MRLSHRIPDTDRAVVHVVPHEESPPRHVREARRASAGDAEAAEPARARRSALPPCRRKNPSVGGSDAVAEAGARAVALQEAAAELPRRASSRRCRRLIATASSRRRSPQPDRVSAPATRARLAATSAVSPGSGSPDVSRAISRNDDDQPVVADEPGHAGSVAVPWLDSSAVRVGVPRGDGCRRAARRARSRVGAEADAAGARGRGRAGRRARRPSFPDDAYEEAGAQLVDAALDADVVVKVAPPSARRGRGAASATRCCRLPRAAHRRRGDRAPREPRRHGVRDGVDPAHHARAAARRALVAGDRRPATRRRCSPRTSCRASSRC